MAYLQVSTRLKQLRTERQLTQTQIADRVGITRSTLSAYENETRYPSYDILVKLAYLFGVSTDYLLGKETLYTLDLTGLSAKEITVVVDMVNLLRSKQ